MKFRPLKLMKGKKSEVGQTALLKPNFVLLNLLDAGFLGYCNLQVEGGGAMTSLGTLAKTELLYSKNAGA